jgi:hypothetical protein
LLDDHDPYVSRDGIVQFDTNGVQPDGLDRLGDLHRAFVDRRPTGLLDGGGDVTCSDGTEQLTSVASPSRQVDGQAFQLLAHFLSMIEAANLPRRAAPLDAVDLLLGTAGPADSEARGTRKLRP